MKVDFNNLRKKAIYACDALTDKLNNAILKHDEYAKPNSVYHDQQVNIKGYVLIDTEEIQNEMDELRDLIGAIGMVHEEGNKEFVNVFEEKYAKGSMKSFNDEDSVE